MFFDELDEINDNFDSREFDFPKYPMDAPKPSNTPEDVAAKELIQMFSEQKDGSGVPQEACIDICMGTDMNPDDVWAAVCKISGKK